MGADACFVFFGLRYDISSDEELEGVEAQTDSRVRRAKKARLQFALGRPTDGESHFLLVGAQLAIVGVENQRSAVLSEADLAKVAPETRKRLLDAGFDADPALHFQLHAQY